MAGLVAGEAVVKPGAVVSEDMNAGTLPKLPKGNVCVVFKNLQSLSKSGLIGVVNSDTIAQQPDIPLASIAQPVPVVNESQPVIEVLKLLRSEQPYSLPVFDVRNNFAGVISQRSILDALLRRERHLLRKTREFRQTANDDKERRYETTRRLEQTNQAFHKLLLALSRPENLESFRPALEALNVVTNAGWSQLALCDDKGRVTQRLLASHPSIESHPPNYAAENLMQEVLKENRLVRQQVFPVSGDDPTAESGNRKKQAFLGLPLTIDERRFGCVYLWDKIESRGFVDDDEVLLASLGHAVALTIAHAVDHARRKRLEEELDLLAKLARQTGGAGSLEEIAEIIRDRTHDYWKWDAFSVSISRSNGNKFQGILAVDKAISSLEGGTRTEEPYVVATSVNEGLCQTSRIQLNRRLLSGEPALINRQDLDNVELLKPFGDTSRPSASLMYVPIVKGIRILGILTVQSYKKNRFGSPDIDLFQRVADAVSPAFARCIAEIQTRAFFDLANLLSAASTPREAAKIIVDVADSLIGWDSCSVYFYNEATDEHTHVLMMDIVNGERMEIDASMMRQTSGNSKPRPRGLSRKVIAERSPLLYLRPEPRFESTQSEPFGDTSRPSASLMHVPLQFKDKVLGVLSLQSYSINAYDNEDLNLLTALADQCCGAIERIQNT